MYCKTYHCRMSPYACIARQKNAQMGGAKNAYKAGAGDVICADCEQGREIMAKHDPKAAAKYSKRLRDIRSKARDALDNPPAEKKPQSKPKAKPMPEKTHARELFKPIGKKKPEQKPADDDIFYLDFKDYPQLWDTLQEEAEKQFRPLDMHVLFILYNHVKGVGKGIVQ